MNRRLLLAALMVSLILGGQTAPAAVLYTVTDLGTLGGRSSWALGINSSGQVVGCSETSIPLTSPEHAFLYSGLTMRDLGGLRPGALSSAAGINDSGQVVGYSWTTSNAFHAFRYSGSTMTDLGTLGTDSYATGINSSGQVVGYSRIGDTQHAFLYSGSTMRDLGTFGGNTYATGINSSGQVVGGSDLNPGSGPTRAFLYSGSTMRDLGTGDASKANGINDSGQVVGYFCPSVGTHAFLCSGSEITDLGTLGGIYSEAFGINSSGRVVGASWLADNGTAHAFFYDGSTMSDLNSLIDAGSGWTLTGARGINDAGQIVGSGYYNGASHAYVLTPVPEPGTLAMLSAAGLGLVALAYRRRLRGAAQAA